MKSMSPGARLPHEAIADGKREFSNAIGSSVARAGVRHSRGGWTARGISDQEVLSIAVAVESRWILTFDRDYGELIYARKMPVPPAVLFIRLTSYRPEDPGHLLVEILENPSQFHGYFVVVEKDGWRKRPLPQR